MSGEARLDLEDFGGDRRRRGRRLRLLSHGLSTVGQPASSTLEVGPPRAIIERLVKAITVVPHQPESARLEDVPEPDAREGSVLVEAIAVGVCGTDVEIVEGKYGWAPPGQTRLVLGHESLGRVIDPGPSSGLRDGRPRRRHRPAPRPGAVPELRGRRVGHVPQRPVHRARHQGDRRLHVRALADRARVRDEGRPVARPARRAARADDGRHQGVGAGRRGRPARLLGAAHRARHRRRPDRPAGGARRQAARARGPRPGPGGVGRQAGARAGARRDVSQRHGRGRRLRAGRHRRVHGRRAGHRRRDPGGGARAASSASRASAAAAGPPACPPPTSPRRSCSRTTSSSAA